MHCIGTNNVRTQEIVYEHYGNDFPYEKFRGESSVLFHEIAGTQGIPVKPGASNTATLKFRISSVAGIRSGTMMGRRHALCAERMPL